MATKVDEYIKELFSKEETWRLESMITQYTRFYKESVTNIAGNVLQRSMWAAEEVLKERKTKQNGQ